MPLKQSADGVRGGTEARHSPELDRGESCFFHQPQLVPDRDRPADSLRPGLKTARQFCGQIILQDHISELQPSIGLEHPV